MPRSTKSRGVQETTGGIATIEREEEDEDVTTAELEDEEGLENDTDPAFDFVSEPAPEDFTPDRKTPGRVRRASYFDDILRQPDVFNSGKWQRVPVTSKEHLEAAKRELNRAKLFLNKEGLAEGLPEIGLDLDEREDALYYRARTAQKRERKNGSASSVDDADIEESDEYEDEDAE